MRDVQYPDDSVPNPSAIRIEDLLASDDAGPAPAVREGLPRSFRMRADKHYVEMLDAPPPQPASAEATAGRPAAAESATPAPAASAADVETASATDSAADLEDIAAAVQAGDALAQSLAALRASTNLLSERGPALVTSVAGNLIRAEAWRATCLLQISRFLRGELAVSPKRVRAQAIVDQVLKSIEPERRLRNLTIDERITVGEHAIVVDEDLFVCVLSGLLMATIAVTEQPLTVTFAADVRGSDVTFAIVQEHVRPSSNWATEWLAAGAARVLARCDGRVSMTVIPGGTDIRLAVPRPR